MPGLFVPEPFTEDIMEKARKMRSTIALPSCFDSPYFLARFLRAHGGDEEVVKTKVEEYFSHREVLGYTGCSDMEMFTEFPIGKATFERFTISLMSRSILSGDVHVFLQKMDGTDLKEMCKILIIRPPAIMSLMFKITKFIMDARTLNRLHFLDDVSDLHKYLEPQVSYLSCKVSYFLTVFHLTVICIGDP
ncbi:hypothetical protein GCK32_016124 [Trichostrongylus colubriformis]|uniref:CRAL-TRIO domain-containing protein n=1 Tax=Trichostrongylus colubriformis TaxID=6319 RepID=A0AAN8J1G1_TRICO